MMAVAMMATIPHDHHDGRGRIASFLATTNA
jgi:hypothetical protein